MCLEEAPSNLAIAGRYILTPEIFDILEKIEPGVDDELQLTDAIDQLNKTQRVFAKKVEGKRYDVGNKIGYMKMSLEYGLEHPETAEEFSEYIIQLSDKLEGVSFKADTTNLTISTKATGTEASLEIKDGVTKEAFKATFQVGANSNQTISVEINDMRAKALGVDKLDLTTSEGSQAATTTIQAAIEKVSTERANLGAVQNRLEYTISNLDNTAENLTSAESTLRDVDMAKEMMEFSKNNILNQAAQAMISQANQQPQNVLQLLR